jgi:hypothetical protein
VRGQSPFHSLNKIFPLFKKNMRHASEYLTVCFVLQRAKQLTLQATEELTTPLLVEPRGHPPSPPSNTLSYWFKYLNPVLGERERGGLDLGGGRKKQYGVVAAAKFLARHWLQQHLGTSKGAMSGSGIARASSSTPPACQ